MELINLAQLSSKQKKEIVLIWNNEYPAKIAFPDMDAFEAYLKNLTDQHHSLLINDQEMVKGWYFDFIRDQERWFAIIIDSSCHGLGFGTRLLENAKAWNHTLNGWAIDHDRDIRKNGSPYRSPISFYLKNGFKVLSGTRLETDLISAVKIQWEKQDLA